MQIVFQQAIPVMEKIENAGYEAYFVGGSVRDYLLGKEIDDVDIASSAQPHEIKAIFEKTVDVGIEHGTVLVLYKGQSYEITTFRSESEYLDFRKPKSVQFIRSLHEDLKRRDFTMNSIAMTKNGEIIDPFHGHEAIRGKSIQTVGCAQERFTEDALRMMRAVRFVSQLSFSIEESTFLALKKYSALLGKISVERKTKEFEKLLCGSNRRLAMHYLVETNLHLYLPGLKEQEDCLRRLASLPSEQLNLLEQWVLLLHFLDGSPTENQTFLKSWRLSNEKISQILLITKILKERLGNVWKDSSVYRAGGDIAVKVEKIYNIINGYAVDTNVNSILELFNNLPIKTRNDLAVSSHELMSWKNCPGGPWLKELFAKIEDAVLTNSVKNEREAIREWLMRCNQK